MPLTTANDNEWTAFLAAVREDRPLPAGPWTDMFGHLSVKGADGLTVFAQIGQTIDGRIATETGHSHYINGAEGITHLHRLRAIADAVVIGVGTALADDPQLNVRHVTGPSPARVLIDRTGRVPPSAKIFRDDGSRKLLITSGDRQIPHVETIQLKERDGAFAPGDVIKALAARGLRRILIEGGAHTVSAFLQAQCLDRLHVIVAPFVLGSGRPGFTLPVVERVDEVQRWTVKSFPLGSDILFDCELKSRR